MSKAAMLVLEDGRAYRGTSFGATGSAFGEAAYPSIHEKAAALLKIAEGQIASQVAEHGLLQPHDPDIIYRWLKRWQTAGVEGLVVKKGRGRKAAFSP